MLRNGSTSTAATEPWQRLLGGFETVGLEGAADTATRDRIDTKFVLRSTAAFEALSAVAEDYRALDIDGLRFTTYRTQYFDTESFALFRRHHAGGSNRYKLRSRTYLNTNLSFIELKSKTPRGMTTKIRQQTEEFETRLLPDARAFVDANCAVPSSAFLPALLNRFDRICLVSRSSRERLTIDLDIEVETRKGRLQLPGIAVAELKQERSDQGHRDTAFLRQMRAMKVRPTGFSKYCICLLLTNPEIKHNLFKPQVKRLRRLMEEPNVVR